MSITPNRIMLISRGRHEEGKSAVPMWPGMLAIRNPDGTISPHNVYGQNWPALVVKEDALRGNDITQVLPASDGIPLQAVAKGDVMLMLLQKGANVTAEQPLISAGDGTLVAVPTDPLNQAAAASTTITSTAAETIFSTANYSMAGSTVKVAGDVIKIEGQGTVLSQHSADTQDVKVYLGSGNLVLDFGALNLPAGSTFWFDLSFRFTVVGASGSFVGTGTYGYQLGPAPALTQAGPLATSGAITETIFTLGATSLDTTGTAVVKASATASASNALNQIVLNQWKVSLVTEQDPMPIVRSGEAINNSSGTGTSGFNNAAFIRCSVL